MLVQTILIHIGIFIAILSIIALIEYIVTKYKDSNK